MLCDAISVGMSVTIILTVNLNLVGLFGHDLAYHPHLSKYSAIMAE